MEEMEGVGWKILVECLEHLLAVHEVEHLLDPSHTRDPDQDWNSPVAYALRAKEASILSGSQ